MIKRLIEHKVVAILVTDELVKGLSADEISNLKYEFEDAFEFALQNKCEQEGHKVDDDHCGRPEHRFCHRCFKSTPNVEISPTR